VRKRKLDNRIRFLGEIDDVDRLLALSNVHLCPSLCQEALGLVVLEAKCSGRPSVVFPSGALPEIVTHGVDGYVCEAATVDALKTACLYYIENPERARRHGIEAKRSLERLGVDSFAQRWRAVYDSVV
jgi:glycosyltransferase involved in cell wall biosynthesis